MYASSAWSSASTPTDAVTPGGHVSVSSGSTIATDGRRYWCETPVFVPSRGKSITATVVTSDPVPDVVGTRDEGKHRPGNLPAAADRGVDEVEQLSVVRGEERAELRRVERRAAADPDEAVEAVAGRLDGLLNGGLARLAGDAVVDDRLDAGRAERRLEALPEPGFGHEPVADEKRPRDPEAASVLARLGRGPCAEDDACAVERDDRGVAAAHEPLAADRPARRPTAVIASSIETTSPYFASMSSSEALCASVARSATASRGTRTR